MPAKSQIRWLLAALILAAYAHCLFSHAAEAADRHRQLQLDAQPLDNSRATCENESSCICKGATLATDVKLPVPERSLVDAACVQPAAYHGCLSGVSDRQISPAEESSPISGKMLRARLPRYLL
jgi:hypothetical protein